MNKCTSRRWTTERALSHASRAYRVVLAIRESLRMTHNPWCLRSSLCRIVVMLLSACLLSAGLTQAQAPVPGDPNATVRGVMTNDHDNDDVTDDSDLDDDNDGIADLIEGHSINNVVDLTVAPTLLSGSGTVANALVGDVFLYDNAISDGVNTFDIVVQVVAIQRDLVTEVLDFSTTNFFEIGSDDADPDSKFDPTQDEHAIVRLHIVEDGSATAINPNGTPATVHNAVFTFSDIDSDVGRNFTEVFGYSQDTPADTVNLPGTPSALENEGFINGGGPSGYRVYRLNPATVGSPATWTDEINAAPGSPDVSVELRFDTLSELEVVFGVTGPGAGVFRRGVPVAASATIAIDTDGDGVANHLDLDADNDGISDLRESGQDAAMVDINDNGIRDDIANDPVNNDADNNGLADAVDSEHGNTEVTPRNMDTTGPADYLDLDADGDGIPDNVEAQGTAAYNAPSLTPDANGFNDNYGGVSLTPVDTDGNTPPDYLDTDSDGDNLLDSAESGLVLTGNDANGDGIDDGINASYSDVNGDVNDPSMNLANAGGSGEVDFRNLVPTAADDQASTSSGMAVSFSVTDNDSDVDGSVDVTTVDLDPNTPGVQTTVVVPGEGAFAVDNNGSVTFTSEASFAGTSSISYVVRDNDGAVSNAATITVMVNAPPVANADSTSTQFNTPVTLAVTANDTDADGSIDSASVDLDPNTAGRQTTFAVVGEGSYSVDDSGVVTFSPETGFAGASSISYTVNDNDGAVSDAATITVTVNAPPVANADSTSTQVDTPVSVTVTANDTDTDGSIDSASVDLAPNTAGQQTTVTVAGEGTYSVNASGVVTFTPASGFSGTSSMLYTVSDNDGAVSNAVTITVTVNAPPVANADSTSTQIDTPVSVTVTANDTDADGSIDSASVDLDPNTAGQQTTVTVAGEGTYSVNASGVVTFTPASGFSGTSSVSYTVSDNAGASSNLATLTVGVNAVPTAVDDSATTERGAAVTINVTANDADSDGNIDATTVDLDPATAGRQTTFAVAGEGTFSVDNAGNVTFTPEVDFTGTSILSYAVQDDSGGTAMGTVSITVVDSSLNPPSGLLTADPSDLPALEWRMVWINNNNTTDNLVQIVADIPAGTTFAPGSLTCNPQGNSTMIRCDFVPGGSQTASGRQTVGGQVVFEGSLGADPGSTNENDAANEVIITFVSLTPPNFSGFIQSQGRANWDADGDGSVDDDIAGGQTAVTSDDPISITPEDATVVVIPPSAGVCLFQVRDAPVTQAPDGNDDANESSDSPEDEIETSTIRQVDAFLGLTTPLEGQVIAGSSVAVAVIEGPSQGTTISSPINVTIANNELSATPDIIESDGAKTEVVPGRDDHVVVTQEGVLVSIPAGGLDTEETLIITEVDVANAPGALPGGTFEILYDIALSSGQTQFTSPLTLRLPYDDVDQNGRIDGTNPAVSETALTLWRFDTGQGLWVQLSGAVIVPENNVILVPIDQSGLIGLFLVNSATPVNVGTRDDDVVAFSTAQASAEDSDPVGWSEIATVSLAPFVASWDTTRLVDGSYQLRAVCTDDPTALEEFIDSIVVNATAGASDGGGGCSLTPGTRADPTLLITLSAIVFYLGWRRRQSPVAESRP